MYGGNIMSNSFLQIKYQLLQKSYAPSANDSLNIWVPTCILHISTGNLSANITMNTHITKDQWFPNIITPHYFHSNINQKYTFPKHFFTF